jgi:hypothetical protein
VFEACPAAQGSNPFLQQGFGNEANPTPSSGDFLLPPLFMLLVNSVLRLFFPCSALLFSAELPVLRVFFALFPIHPPPFTEIYRLG